MAVPRLSSASPENSGTSFLRLPCRNLTSWAGERDLYEWARLRATLKMK